MARKEKKYHFIYKTTNLLSGKYYIGMHSTNDLNDGYMGSGRRLRYSINKYGKENHKVEIVEFFENRKQLANREKEIINIDLVNDKYCMNLVIGGGGFAMDEHHKKCTLKANQVVSIKFKTDKEFFKKHSERSSKIMKKTHSEGKIKYDTFSGKKHSEDTKTKMKDSHSGKHVGNKNSQFGTCWINKSGIDKKIKKTEIENYKLDNWKLGRTKK